MAHFPTLLDIIICAPSIYNSKWENIINSILISHSKQYQDNDTVERTTLLAPLNLKVPIAFQTNNESAPTSTDIGIEENTIRQT